ncbi:caspase family protein [Niabella insulamsoli]|uniref:caspase family protein n=1 Tax=Niabella insulamsoli TaxID=3144874 RepID=UPI0031FD8A57
MPYAISLHIGLNKIDKKHYGSDYPLAGCINDAKDMIAIAKQKKYDESYILIDEAGTYKNITDHLVMAAKKLRKGDLFFISYSGHGAYVPDKNKDEIDGKDETWCLYDRMILDDELAQYWARFKRGVRIFMISDSCHSGTVSRAIKPDGTLDGPLEGRTRLIKEGPKIFAKHKSLYNNATSGSAGLKAKRINASVILLSGCQDNQTSLDGDKNGLFTEKMLKVYKKGTFAGNYAQLLRDILKLMPSNQTPNYYLSGFRNKTFESGKPFEK